MHAGPLEVKASICCGSRLRLFAMTFQSRCSLTAMTWPFYKRSSKRVGAARLCLGIVVVYERRLPFTIRWAACLSAYFSNKKKSNRQISNI